MSRDRDGTCSADRWRSGGHARGGRQAPENMVRLRRRDVRQQAAGARGHGHCAEVVDHAQRMHGSVTDDPICAVFGPSRAAKGSANSLHRRGWTGRASWGGPNHSERAPKSAAVISLEDQTGFPYNADSASTSRPTGVAPGPCRTVALRRGVGLRCADRG